MQFEVRGWKWALARLKRQGKDESEEYKAVLETYARRHSWRRTYFGSHSKKLKSGTNLTGGKFHIVFDVKQDWCVPNICTQWWALHKHTFAHSAGHHTNIQMQVERYPRGEGVLYERSRKLIWHSAPPAGSCNFYIFHATN